MKTIYNKSFILLEELFKNAVMINSNEWTRFKLSGCLSGGYCYYSPKYGNFQFIIKDLEVVTGCDCVFVKNIWVVIKDSTEEYLGSFGFLDFRDKVRKYRKHIKKTIKLTNQKIMQEDNKKVENNILNGF